MRIHCGTSLDIKLIETNIIIIPQSLQGDHTEFSILFKIYKFPFQFQFCKILENENHKISAIFIHILNFLSQLSDVNISEMIIKPLIILYFTVFFAI